MSRTAHNTFWKPDYATRKALANGRRKLAALRAAKRYSYALLAIAAIG